MGFVVIAMFNVVYYVVYVEIKLKRNFLTGRYRIQRKKLCQFELIHRILFK